MSADRLHEYRNFIDLFNRDGSRALRLCSEIIFYLNDAALVHPDGLLEVHDRALALTGDRIKFVRNGDRTRWKARPKDITGLLRAWFAKGGPYKGSYVLFCESGAEPEEPSDCAVFFSWVLGDGYVRLILPAEAAIVDPEHFSRLAADLAALVDFRWGCAGISTNSYYGYSGSQEGSGLDRIGKRFLGVDLGTPLHWSAMTKQGGCIKAVNWLTFLGKELAQKAFDSHGGQSEFASALGGNVALSQLPHGLALQAGVAPSFGDIERGETLPEYRQVSRALTALKIPPLVLRNYDEIGGTENTRKWLNRFD